MNFLLPPNYMMLIAALPPEKQLTGFLWLMLQLYTTVFIMTILNVALILTIVWGGLLICRLLGIPWVDGTTKGFINRE